MSSLITADIARGLWSHLSGRFGSVVTEKADSTLMKVAGQLLDVGGIMDRDTFMERFSTTIHGRVYTSFRVGEPTKRCSLWDQCRVAVHEHQHVIQERRDGFARYSSQYLCSSSYRAGYEAEAYGAGLELDYWLMCGTLDLDKSPRDLAEKIRAYGCEQDDIDMAEVMLTIRASTIRAGRVESEAAKAAINWLDGAIA